MLVRPPLRHSTPLDLCVPVKDDRKEVREKTMWAIEVGKFSFAGCEGCERKWACHGTRRR
jgi:hypothetical protein